MIGRNLGKYQTVEPRGEGGMATVYKAYEPTPNNGDVMTTDTQGTMTFTYSTAEHHTDVEKFFEEEMVANGWSLISKSDTSA
jgi:hypothetical protein